MLIKFILKGLQRFVRRTFQAESLIHPSEASFHLRRSLSNICDIAVLRRPAIRWQSGAGPGVHVLFQAFQRREKSTHLSRSSHAFQLWSARSGRWAEAEWLGCWAMTKESKYGQHQKQCPESVTPLTHDSAGEEGGSLAHGRRLTLWKENVHFRKKFIKNMPEGCPVKSADLPLNHQSRPLNFDILQKDLTMADRDLWPRLP